MSMMLDVNGYLQRTDVQWPVKPNLNCMDDSVNSLLSALPLSEGRGSSIDSDSSYTYSVCPSDDSFAVTQHVTEDLLVPELGKPAQV